MAATLYKLLLMVAVETTLADAGKILLLPFPWKSHVFEYTGIGETLVEHGHDVHMMLPPSYPDLQEVKSRSMMKVIEYRIVDIDIYEMPSDDVDDMIASLMEITPIEDFRTSVEGFKQFCSNPLSDEDLFQTLRAEKFDLAIVDAFPCARCYFVIPYRLDIPYVSVTTTYEPWLMRVPAIPSFVPFPLAQFYGEKMTFMERILNTYFLLDWTINTRVPYISDEVIQQYVPDKPYRALNDLARDSKLWLFDTDVIIDYPRPKMPHEINIGGLSTKPSKPLPEDLLEFVEASEGFIIVSFGSFDVLTESKLKEFIAVFRHITLRVILRSTIDPKVVDTPENVKLMSWIPQNDLLGHPKCRLFITHCGANGQFEALYHGIPMLGFPIFGDQPYNARRMVHHGFGLFLDSVNIDVEEMVATIKELTKNPSYTQNIRKASKVFRGRPMDPRQTAAYWIEQALDDNVEYLRSYALDMPWYEYLMLDVLALACVVVGLLTVTCYCIICRCLCRPGSRKTKTE